MSTCSKIDSALTSLLFSFLFFFFFSDCPASLVSSDRSVPVPVEASIEDLHCIQYKTFSDSIQSDAVADSTPPALEEKLNQELWYHKHGSYISGNESDTGSHLHHSISDPFLPNVTTTDQALRQREPDRLSNMSSVHSWTKSESAVPVSQEEAFSYRSMNTSTPTSSLLPTSASTPSLPQLNQQHPHSHYDRQKSWPTFPVTDTSAPDNSHARLLPHAKNSFPQDPGAPSNLFNLVYI